MRILNLPSVKIFASVFSAKKKITQINTKISDNVTSGTSLIKQVNQIIAGYNILVNANECTKVPILEARVFSHSSKFKFILTKVILRNTFFK